MNAQGLTTESAELVLTDVEAIVTLAPAVKQVAPQIIGVMQLSRQGRSLQVNVTGTSKGIVYVRNLQLRQGRFFDRLEQQQNAQVIVLGSEISRKLFPRSSPLGKSVQVDNLTFQVIGIMQPKGAFMGVNYDDTAYVPITTMAARLTGKRSPHGIPIDYLELSAIDKNNVRAAAFQTTNILTRRHGKKDFTVFANKSFQDLMAQITASLSILLASIAGISLLVGGIGIMNIMLVSVTERTQEIGLRKAIGASEGAILSQFLIEAIILSIAGGVVGMGVGVSGAVIVGIFTPLQPSVPLGALILATGVSGSIGIIFGVAPARQAAKLDPIAALRGT